MSASVLIFHTADHVVALPVSQVVETMRALDREPIAAMPKVVLGVATIRGEIVPVVDLARILGGESTTEVHRYVLVAADARRVALAVRGVEGVVELPDAERLGLPPLLDQADRSVVEAIAMRDGHALEILESARLLPPGFWRELDLDGRGADGV